MRVNFNLLYRPLHGLFHHYTQLRSCKSKKSKFFTSYRALDLTSNAMFGRIHYASPCLQTFHHTMPLIVYDNVPVRLLGTRFANAMSCFEPGP
jgi:hypothetical protein